MWNLVPAQKDRQTTREFPRMWPFPTVSLPGGSTKVRLGERRQSGYGWPCIDTPDGRFYRCSGQAAQPYMYPALKNNEQEIERIFEEAVKKKK